MLYECLERSAISSRLQRWKQTPKMEVTVAYGGILRGTSPVQERIRSARGKRPCDNCSGITAEEGVAVCQQAQEWWEAVHGDRTKWQSTYPVSVVQTDVACSNVTQEGCLAVVEPCHGTWLLAIANRGCDWIVDLGESFIGMVASFQLHVCSHRESLRHPQGASREEEIARCRKRTW